MSIQEIYSKKKDSKYFKKTLEEITKEELENFYINNSFENTAKHFHITIETVKCLLIHFNIPFRTKEQENNLRSKKTIESRISNSGSLEFSYSKGKEKQKQTLINKYGSLENAYQKQKESRIKTTQERYGVDNIFHIYRRKKKPRKEINFCSLPQYYKNYKYDYSKKEYLYNNLEGEREFNLGKYSYDFKINNILIEINPTITHNSTWSPFDIKDKKYHYNKTKYAADNGYRCINIWDWDDIDKIIYLLTPKEKIYARKCIIKEVPKEEAKIFINKYHLQGYAKDSIRIGLYYNNELVSIMTFDKPRYNRNYEYELVRYCSSKNIIGGAEKLFKCFSNNSIISYCDLSKFNGITYNKLGFELKNISISKHWYNISTKQHITDNLLRQRGYDQLFNTSYGKGSSNEQLMKQSGFLEVYDSGQATYVYKI